MPINVGALRLHHLAFACLGGLIITACASRAPDDTTSSELPLLSDAKQITANGDGTFRVECKNGVIETSVTEQAILTQQICNSPLPGTTCSQPNHIVSKGCGMCGTREALCMPDPNGTGHVWSEYSACVGEMPNGCTPGDEVTEACGRCGQRKKTCQQNCQWNVGACEGEPQDACFAGATELTPAGCATLDSYRTRACDSGTCQWGQFSQTCSSVPDYFTVDAKTTAGEIASVVVPFAPQRASKRLAYGNCETGTARLSGTSGHLYQYVRVNNPGALPVRVSLFNSRAEADDEVIDTNMVAYATFPGHNASDVSRTSCLRGVGYSCSNPLVRDLCGDRRYASLSGTWSTGGSVEIPAQGSIYVWIGTVAEHTTSPGRIAFGVLTEAQQP